MELEDLLLVLVAYVVCFHALGPDGLHLLHVREDVEGPKGFVASYGDLFAGVSVEVSYQTCHPCHWRKLYPPIAPQYHVAMQPENSVIRCEKDLVPP